MSNSLTYRAVARYMSGTNVIGYHLVRSDGIEQKVNKEKTIFLIGKGLVENMRVQSDENGNVIIRGKGTNLNNLPVYNLGSISKKDKLKVVGRVTKDGKLVGYLVDDKKKKKSMSFNELIKECIAGNIENAEVHEEVYKATGKKGYVITGIGYDIKKLNTFDIEEINMDNTNNKTEHVKATRAKQAGVLVNVRTGKRDEIKAGDVIVASSDGKVNVQSVTEFSSKYKEIKEDVTVSDSISNYIINSCNKFVKLNTMMVSKWISASKVC